MSALFVRLSSFFRAFPFENKNNQCGWMVGDVTSLADTRHKGSEILKRCVGCRLDLNDVFPVPHQTKKQQLSEALRDVVNRYP